MRRFPDGVHALSWYQTECRGRPDWLSVLRIQGPTGKVHEFCVVEDVPSGPAPDRPTAMVLDLDPGPPARLLVCCAIARLGDLFAPVRDARVPRLERSHVLALAS